MEGNFILIKYLYSKMIINEQNWKIASSSWKAENLHLLIIKTRQTLEFN